MEDLKTNTLRMDLSIEKNSKDIIIIKDIIEIEEQDVFLINGLMPTDQPYNKSGKEIYAEKVIKMKRNFIEGNRLIILVIMEYVQLLLNNHLSLMDNNPPD